MMVSFSMLTIAANDKKKRRRLHLQLLSARFLPIATTHLAMRPVWLRPTVLYLTLQAS